MNASSIAKRVAAMYWDPNESTSAESEDVPEKVEDLADDVKRKNPEYDAGKAKATAWSIYCDSVNPDSPHCKQDEYFDGRKSSVSPAEAALELRAIADGIDSAEHPDPALVAADVGRLAGMLRTSDAKSLARNIREEAWGRIRSMFPSETWDLSVGHGSGLYDTNDLGKGWKEGYVSFGAKPTVWSNAGLVGGILFRFRYAPQGIAPERGTPEYEEWQRGGGLGTEKSVAEVGKLSGGYYNKQPGGTVEAFSGSGDAPDTLFGQALFEVDPSEAVVDWVWEDAGSVKQAVQKIIDDIAAHPPVDAVSRNKVVQQRLNPYTSLKKFHNFLIKERRNKFYADEAKLVAQAEERSVLTVVEALQRRGFEYVQSPAPFPLSLPKTP